MPNAASSENNTGFSKVVYISQEALQKKIDEKVEKKSNFRLIDLRIKADYDKGHIPGAENAPLRYKKKKNKFLIEKKITPSEEVILYRYSRNDPAAVNAAIILANRGFARVLFLEGGIEEWKGKKE